MSIAEWDANLDVLVVRFRYDPATKDFVKSLPGARFDWTSKTWRFRREDAVGALGPLAEHGFDVAQAADALDVDVEAAAAEGPDALSVRLLAAQAARALAGAFPDPIWLVAEVDGWSRTKHRRHAWFDLVERDSRDDVVATVGAVMFESARRRMESKLAAASVELEDGLSVRVRVRVELYEARSKFQVIVEDVDPAWSAGELAMRRERVLAAVRAAGVADRNLGLSLPAVPLRVALLTSAGSDAFHDFVSSLRRSGYAFDVTVFDVRVQGDQLAPTVLAALHRVQLHADRFDVVVITRGGGSRVELGAWDDVDVAMAVATCPVKVLVAIGHQQDQSALDALAHSCKTPTEAGETLVDAIVGCDAQLDHLAGRLRTAAPRQLEEAARTLRDGARRLAVAARASMAEQRFAVERAWPDQLRRGAQRTLTREQQRLDGAAHRLQPERVAPGIARQRRALLQLAERVGRSATRGTAAEAQTLTQLTQRLERAAAVRQREAGRALDHLGARIRLADPSQVLARGFALVTDSDGAYVMDRDQARDAASITLQFRDGQIAARVDSDNQDDA